METYTVRFAHLAEIPIQKIGDIIFRGDKVGRMGNTGQSTADHVHTDVIEGLVDKIIRLEEIGYEEGKSYLPNIKQLNYFIDDELFGIGPVITTYFYDPEYKVKYRKDHPGYDLVPSDYDTMDHYNIYWNRSKTGIILAVGYDAGYGNYILIGFEA